MEESNKLIRTWRKVEWRQSIIEVTTMSFRSPSPSPTPDADPVHLRNGGPQISHHLSSVIMIGGYNSSSTSQIMPTSMIVYNPVHKCCCNIPVRIDVGHMHASCFMSWNISRLHHMKVERIWVAASTIWRSTSQKKTS